MRRIQRVSKVVKLLGYALMGVFLISCAGIGVFMLVKSPQEPSLRWLLLGGVVTGLLLAGVSHRAAKLASLYEQGQLFTEAHVRHLRAIGWFLLLTTVGIGIGYDEGLTRVVSEPTFSPGSLVGGLLFIFVSWVMDEGRKLDQEHRLTI